MCHINRERKTGLQVLTPQVGEGDGLDQVYNENFLPLSSSIRGELMSKDHYKVWITIVGQSMFSVHCGNINQTFFFSLAMRFYDKQVK